MPGMNEKRESPVGDSPFLCFMPYWFYAALRLFNLS
jgi:hypothetical protein